MDWIKYFIINAKLNSNSPYVEFDINGIHLGNHYHKGKNILLNFNTKKRYKWYPNGNIAYSLDFIDIKTIDNQYIWCENGNISYMKCIRKRRSKHFNWYENGYINKIQNKWCDSDGINDILHGVQYKWYPNGKIWSISLYKYGVIRAQYNWHKNGNLCHIYNILDKTNKNI